ncbi:MAG TPA: transcription elongation factor GreB [Kofleriaceae bacterium]|nr:transcription elongation factor GreB [Kofleriaceae bacterium]
MSTRARGGDHQEAAKRKMYITPDGAKRLRAELDQLWTVERPRVTQEVADAAAQGDRSENAEYIYGKRRLREIDRRVRFLSKRLDELTVVSEPPSDPTRCFFGAWVSLEDNDGEQVTYRIVGPDESDVDRGWISMEAPVARALLGKRCDDEVVVRRPKGDITFTIIGIRYTE